MQKVPRTALGVQQKGPERGVAPVGDLREGFKDAGTMWDDISSHESKHESKKKYTI